MDSLAAAASTRTRWECLQHSRKDSELLSAPVALQGSKHCANSNSSSSAKPCEQARLVSLKQDRAQARDDTGRGAG